MYSFGHFKKIGLILIILLGIILFFIDPEYSALYQNVPFVGSRDSIVRHVVAKGQFINYYT